MQRILMQESYTVDYAGFWWRSGAMIIDLVVLWGFNFLMTHIWNLAAGLPWGGLTQDMIESGATAPNWLFRLVVFFRSASRLFRRFLGMARTNAG